jgi:hypothetical protein
MLVEPQGNGLGAFVRLNGLFSLLWVGLALVCRLTDLSSGDVGYDAAFYASFLLPLALLLGNIGLLIQALWRQQFSLALCYVGASGLLWLFLRWILDGVGGHA